MPCEWQFVWTGRPRQRRFVCRDLLFVPQHWARSMCKLVGDWAVQQCLSYWVMRNWHYQHILYPYLYQTLIDHHPLLLPPVWMWDLWRSVPVTSWPIAKRTRSWFVCVIKIFLLSLIYRFFDSATSERKATPFRFATIRTTLSFIPLNTWPASFRPMVPKDGAGPDRNMLAPSAILSVRVGLRMNLAPPGVFSLCRMRDY